MHDHAFNPAAVLHDRLNAAIAACTDWYEAEPPMAISVRNLNVAVVGAALCGMDYEPTNPYPFGNGSTNDAAGTVVDSSDSVVVLRRQAIEALRAVRAAIPGVRPLVAGALGPEWTTILSAWIAELLAYAQASTRAFPNGDQVVLRCVFVIHEISQMAGQLAAADLTPLDGSAQEAGTPMAPSGDWSQPMSKAEMARRLGLKQRAFETWARSKDLRRHGRQLWQVRLDALDSRTRHRLESAPQLARKLA